MANPTSRKGAEEARNQLPDLLEAAEKGRSTIITRHGRPVAALVPIEATGKLAAEMIKGAQLKVYAGAPHATCNTHANQVNADLLAFIQS